MGHDGVRDGAVSGRSRIGVEYLWRSRVRDAVGDSAGVDEDSLVRKGSEQTAPVSDAERVQCDRLPNSVDVAFGDAVPPRTAAARSAPRPRNGPRLSRTHRVKIVHDGGGEEQVLVVVGVIQTALMVGQQAGEEKAADAVIDDRPANRGAGGCEARIGKRPVGRTRMSFMCLERTDTAVRQTVAREPQTAMIGP